MKQHLIPIPMIVLLLTSLAVGTGKSGTVVPLAFDYQLTSLSVDDSISVEFAVHSTNVGRSTVELCGSFYFNCIFKPESDGTSCERRCPVFLILDKKMGSKLDCNPVKLQPGEMVSDTLRFTYNPDYFDDCSGQIEVGAEFVFGQRDAPLNVATHVGGDRMRVLLPVVR